MKEFWRKVSRVWFVVNPLSRIMSMWIAAILVGFFAVGFQTFGHAIAHFWSVYALTLWWLPPIGLALSVYLSHYHFSPAKGGGIPQTAACLTSHPRIALIRQYYFSVKAMVSKTLLTLLSIGSGASLGYEGPIVQIGAAIQYGLVGKRLKHETQVQSVIAAGGAAGLAAAFGTPIAGLMFVLEELSKHGRFRVNGLVVWPIVMAGVTAYYFLGSYRFLGSMPFSIKDVGVFGFAILFGVGGGLLGGMVSFFFQHFDRCLPQWLMQYRVNYPVWMAFFCGLGIAGLGHLSHGQSYGMGYYTTLYLLQGFSPDTALYGLYKLLSLVMSVFSGAVGGVFAPALAVGAGLGASLGAGFDCVPYLMAVLLGMAGFFAGMMRAPLTAFVVVIELTGAMEWVLPLMVTAFMASSISRCVCKVSLYDGQTKQLLAAWSSRSL